MTRVVAIIPARSGSTGLPHKNVRLLNNRPLISYSIDFAKSLKVDAILCTTDSREYADIASSYGAQILGLRSLEASTSQSMENDVIDDLNQKMKEFEFAPPDVVVWLRPTFVFRSTTQTMKAIEDVKNGFYSSSRVVTEVDPRLYRAEGKKLEPLFGNSDVSMVRRQGLPTYYHVYNVDVFSWPTSTCPINFLGSNTSFHVAPQICSVDIDVLEDFTFAETLIKGGASPILD